MVESFQHNDLSGRQRILEGIVTTVNDDGTTNISPMGPMVNETMTHLVLRPFQTSTTYQNLKRVGAGVLHITDDVELLASAAIGRVRAPVHDETDPRHRILRDACRWYAFQVMELNDERERTTIRCEVVDQGRQRDFFGFNRAMHAVVEAAILATRVGIVDDDRIRREMRRLQILVEKTGGGAEQRAFNRLVRYLADKIGLDD